MFPGVYVSLLCSFNALLISIFLLMFHRYAAIYIHHYSIFKAAEQRPISSKKTEKEVPSGFRSAFSGLLRYAPSALLIHT
jgi:hypothetical protein